MKTLFTLFLLVIAASMCDAKNFLQFTNCPTVDGCEVFADAGNVVLTSDTGGILRSTDDGVTWTTDNNGLPLVHGYGWTFASGSNGDVLGGCLIYGRVYRSTNDGNMWTRIADSIGSSDEPVLSLATKSPGRIFVLPGEQSCLETINNI